MLVDESSDESEGDIGTIATEETGLGVALHRLGVLGVTGVNRGVPSLLNNDLVDPGLKEQGDEESPEDDCRGATNKGGLGSWTSSAVFMALSVCLLPDDATAGAHKQA